MIDSTLNAIPLREHLCQGLQIVALKYSPGAVIIFVGIVEEVQFHLALHAISIFFSVTRHARPQSSTQHSASHCSASG